MIKVLTVCLFCVNCLLTTVNVRAGDLPQASGQQTFQAPPNPSKNPPTAQPPTVQYQLQAIPPPQTPPIVQLALQQAAPVQTVQYVAQPVQLAQPTTVQYVTQPAQYVAQQPVVLAGYSKPGHTIVLGPGPIRLAGAWMGAQMVKLGRTHVIQLGHSVVAPVTPVPVQPTVQPTVYVATTTQPVVQQPAPTTYQLVPVPVPMAPPAVQTPNPLREAAPPPPPSPQTSSAIDARPILRVDDAVRQSNALLRDMAREFEN